MADLSQFDDAGLSEHLTEVIAEQERRRILATTPDAILGLVATYLAAGGSIDDLSLVLPTPEPSDDGQQVEQPVDVVGAVDDVDVHADQG